MRPHLSLGIKMSHMPQHTPVPLLRSRQRAPHEPPQYPVPTQRPRDLIDDVLPPLLQRLARSTLARCSQDVGDDIWSSSWREKKRPQKFVKAKRAWALLGSAEMSLIPCWARVRVAGEAGDGPVGFWAKWRATEPPSERTRGVIVVVFLEGVLLWGYVLVR